MIKFRTKRETGLVVADKRHKENGYLLGLIMYKEKWKTNHLKKWKIQLSVQKSEEKEIGWRWYRQQEWKWHKELRFRGAYDNK